MLMTPFCMRAKSAAVLYAREKKIRTWLLSSQQTVLAEQELPLPTPMTVTGEQDSPTSTLRS